MSSQNKQGQQLLAAILDNLNSWDQEVPNGIKIIGKNEVLLTDYQGTKALVTETDYQMIEEIVKKTNLINQRIKTAQELVVKELTQVTKKDKMIEGYLLKPQDSHFIDKDF